MGAWRLIPPALMVILVFLIPGSGQALHTHVWAQTGVTLAASQSSPVSGAVTLTATVADITNLIGVQFKLDGYVLEAEDTTVPCSIVWSAASATSGSHTLTAQARYSDGSVIVSDPLVLTVANPASFNRLLYVDAQAGNDANDGLSLTTAWKTLPKANASVQPGDTVYLKGTFSGQYIRPALSGTADKPIRYASVPGDQAVITRGLYGADVWLDGESYIVIEGLRLMDGPYNVQLGWYDPVHHVTIRGNTIERGVMLVVRSSDNVIEGNVIRNVGSEAKNSGDAIWLANGASRNKILRNHMTNAGHGLIAIGGDRTGDAECRDNVVAYNHLSNPWAMPLAIGWMARRTLVEYNKIRDATQNGVNYPRYGFTLQASDNIIRYNEIFNNTGGGIQINAYTYAGSITQDSINNQIYNNVIYNNGYNGGDGGPGLMISVNHNREVKDNLIVNNIFLRNSGFAFNGSMHTIWIDHYHNFTGWPAGSLNGNTIKNNIFLRQSNSAGEISVIMVPPGAINDLFYTLPEFEAIYSEVENNLEVDPLFVNEAATNFRLQSGSPAIDKGQVLPGVVYNGAAPDIGAYETGTPGDCTCSISPSSKSFSASGGTATVGVATQDGCSWEATSNADWIAITSGSSSTGNGNVDYAVAANTATSSRTGTMTIGGYTFAVSQGGTAQIVLGKSFVAKDPAPGVAPSLRNVIVLGKEPASDDTLVGDPLANGATVEIIANGATPTVQVFSLPAGAAVNGAPGWRTLGNPAVGYSYRDVRGANGPVKEAVISKDASGKFLVKVTAKGALGSGPQPHITVVPPAPGTDGGMRFTINDGDTYCVAFGGAAGGRVTNAPTSGTPTRLFKVVSTAGLPTVEAGCPASH